MKLWRVFDRSIRDAYKSAYVVADTSVDALSQFVTQFGGGTDYSVTCEDSSTLLYRGDVKPVGESLSNRVDHAIVEAEQAVTKVTG